MYTEIPTLRPSTPLLDTIQSPADLKPLSLAELNTLADQLRAYLIYSVGQTGGHFSAGLGVIELTIALHYVLNTPGDDLIWDVGHQTYPHKILTGRRDDMMNMRMLDGLAPFPSRSESPFDSFGSGHSSTSISAALGMAVAKSSAQHSHTVAVIGDGAMTAGMAFEAMNHAAHCKKPLLIILNDNAMSISANVGGLAKHLENIWQQKPELIPELSKDAPSIHKANLFDDIGIDYYGPVDGHDIKTLSNKIKRLLNKKGPSLLHVQTIKGKGFAPAISDPVAYHALSKIEKTPNIIRPPIQKEKYQNIFGQWLCEKAKSDDSVIAITPAMREGSGLLAFSEKYPERFFDVAIAEQHAVTFAAGLACKNKKPVVAVYSTFLQRAYDQIIHDVALQNLDVLFAIDRAGIVGEDGATHNGSFDIAMLRCLPNFVLASPSNHQECVALLDLAYRHEGPSAVRYPRGYAANRREENDAPPTAIGKAHLVRSGRQGCILNFGSLLDETYQVAENLDLGLVDMRWIQPLDESLLLSLTQTYDFFVSVEDGCIKGGAGSGVLELFQRKRIFKSLLQLGHPNTFIEHGSREDILEKLGLNARGIEVMLKRWLAQD